ncbi:MAG: DNA-directed RNA polymerase subunit alpha [Actinobacteria bacterium]|nr:DNA-directed RNA polymerase subunit alpha [Actinomycetota bacterium]
MLIIQRPTIESIGEESENRQRFAVGPLDPGFGHTLGNSLRRTLLSSIPGAAVTKVRFDDAVHEFETIEGMKEDVTDVLLNFKDLLGRVQGDEAATIRLDVTGPLEVTAADLVPSADVEILNPTLRIATLGAGAKLGAEITVERGKGYVTVDRNKASTSIGVIPLDSIFSPVRRVTFEVESARVEQSTNYDRLVLDIETDGSITPQHALASAGETLKNLVALVASLEDEPEGLELGDTGASATGSAQHERRIEELLLTERPYNCLKRGGINTVGQLIDCTPEQLMGLTNFGNKSLDEVIERLSVEGLSLRSDGSEYVPGSVAEIVEEDEVVEEDGQA